QQNLTPPALPHPALPPSAATTSAPALVTPGPPLAHAKASPSSYQGIHHASWPWDFHLTSIFGTSPFDFHFQHFTTPQLTSYATLWDPQGLL
ncbi:hypothetical protein C0993_004203, partial [Termitomyces sp. T159_Od127]